MILCFKHASTTYLTSWDASLKEGTGSYNVRLYVFKTSKTHSHILKHKLTSVLITRGRTSITCGRSSYLVLFTLKCIKYEIEKGTVLTEKIAGWSSLVRTVTFERENFEITQQQLLIFGKLRLIVNLERDELEETSAAQ